MFCRAFVLCLSVLLNMSQIKDVWSQAIMPRISVEDQSNIPDIFTTLDIYNDVHGITLTAPLQNMIEQPIEDPFLHPWQQTILPTKESLNLDVALLKEKLQKEKLLQQPMSSKIRKNKSKVMLFQVRANQRSHLPYWNVQQYLELGAISCMHSACCEFYHDVLRSYGNISGGR